MGRGVPPSRLTGEPPMRFRIIWHLHKALAKSESPNGCWRHYDHDSLVAFPDGRFRLLKSVSKLRHILVASLWIGFARAPAVKRAKGHLASADLVCHYARQAPVASTVAVAVEHRRAVYLSRHHVPELPYAALSVREYHHWGNSRLPLYQSSPHCSGVRIGRPRNFSIFFFNSGIRLSSIFPSDGSRNFFLHSSTARCTPRQSAYRHFVFLTIADMRLDQG